MSSNRYFRPHLELLDDRAMPSIALVAGVLTVVGTGAADGITVWKPAADRIQVDISSTRETRQLALANVTKIVIRGGALRDRITLGDGVTLPTEIFGGRGGDTLAMLPEFREMLKMSGRRESEVPVTLFGVGMNGDALKRARDAGVDRVVFGVPAEARDKVLPLLDKGAALIQP